MAAQQKTFNSNQSNKVPHLHHRPPLDQKIKPHSRPPSLGGSGGSSNNASGYLPGSRVEPRDILREAVKDSPFGLANKDFRDPSREHVKDSSAVCSGDLQKRDYLIKANLQTELNSSNNYPDNRLSYNVDKQRVDPNARSKQVDPTKLPPVNKHDSVRKPEEIKPYLKLETENIKKHLSASTHDKSNTYLNKLMPTTSQKVKSPFDGNPSKSVLKPNTIQVNMPPKSQSFNGGASENAYINRNSVEPPHQFIKTEPPIEFKEEPVTPPVIKRPSLFSPEQTPPHKNEIKPEKNSPILDKKPDTPVTPAFSPFSSPIAVMRDRNPSTSSSEPELRPVMKKIDQVEGFENIMRDSTIGINKLDQVQDMVAPILQMKLEVKPQTMVELDNVLTTQDNLPVSTVERGPVVNGLETNPTIISNLLKEASTVPHLTGSTVPNDNSGHSLPNSMLVDNKPEKEHHHHKSKKKNKEKHKHKDKDRSKEDKEKKKKHKDKDRERHKHKDKHQDISEATTIPAEPIKLKIQKDRYVPLFMYLFKEKFLHIIFQH